MEKVKDHQDVHTTTTTWQATCAVGNDRADGQANMARVQLHDQRTQAALVREFERRKDVAAAVQRLIIDVASWYLTKVHPAFAWVVMSSGFVVGACVAVVFCISMWQMWFYTMPDELKSRHRNAAQLID